MDGKTTAEEENGGTMDDCAYGGGCIIADGERYLCIKPWEKSRRRVKRAKKSKEDEEDGEEKNRKDTPPQLRDDGNYCIYIYIYIQPGKLSERIVPVC